MTKLAYYIACSPLCAGYGRHHVHRQLTWLADVKNSAVGRDWRFGQQFLPGDVLTIAQKRILSGTSKQQ